MELTPKKKDFLVPFDEKGNQQTWCCGWMMEKYSREPFEFNATLTYKDFERGRSALNIVWVSDEGIEYRSGMYLLDTHLKRGGGNKITGTFTFKKQGTSVLLALKEDK